MKRPFRPEASAGGDDDVPIMEGIGQFRQADPLASCQLPSGLAGIMTAQWSSNDPLEIRQLIREISLANPLWGAPRLHGELLKLGIDVGQTIVAKDMARGKATAVPRVEDVPS
jgi:hypothetical protein